MSMSRGSVWPGNLDFVLDGLQVSLDGRTTVPVWTFIYAGDEAHLLRMA